MNFRYIYLFFPYLFSQLVSDPVTKYFICWAGSFLIIWLSITGRIVRPEGDNAGILNNLFRPLYLLQVLFSFYMSISSIFFLAQAMGYYNFTYISYLKRDTQDIEVIAYCQQLYSLAHASLAAGLLLASNSNKTSKWRYNIDIQNPSLYFTIMVISFLLSVVCSIVPGFDQFKLNFTGISFVSSFWLFYYSMMQKNILFIFFSISVIGINYVNSIYTGWKELTLIPLIILVSVFLPKYPKTTLIYGTFAIIVWFSFIPAFTEALRQTDEEWIAGKIDDTDVDFALRTISSNEEFVKSTNWEFLSGRLSEINLFEIYVQKVPELRPYYEFEITGQALTMIIPRVFWPSKPNVEKLVMERVYENGVVNENSKISAKPQFVVDSYLSFGAPGIFFALLFLGYIFTSLSNFSENILCNYEIGSGLFFTGVTMYLWKGSCYEFIANYLFWGFVTLYITALIFRLLGLIIRKDI